MDNFVDKASENIWDFTDILKHLGTALVRLTVILCLGKLVCFLKETVSTNFAQTVNVNCVTIIKVAIEIVLLNSAPVPVATETFKGHTSPRTSNLTRITHCDFLWVHGDIDRPHLPRKSGYTQQIAASSFPAATLSVDSSVTQWMFQQEVLVSCLCSGPGRWTTAVVAFTYLFMYPSPHYTHSLAIAFCMITRGWKSSYARISIFPF